MSFFPLVHGIVSQGGVAVPGPGPGPDPELLTAAMAYAKSVAPSGSYPDTGDAELTNGVFPTATFPGDLSQWVGWQNQNDVSIEFDFGIAVVVTEGRVWGLHQSASGIWRSALVTLEWSNDGSSWTGAGDEVPTVASASETWESWITSTEATGHRYWRIRCTREAGREWLFLGRWNCTGSEVGIGGVVQPTINLLDPASAGFFHWSRQEAPVSNWTGLIWPTEVVRVTLPFRADWTEWYAPPKAPHMGVDIAPWAGSHGRPVRAPLSGKVTHVGNHKAAGLEVVITSHIPFAWRARDVKGNWVTFGAGEAVHVRMTHHQEVLVNVGTVVQAGELVARIGSTGTNTSGPHVHLEVRKGPYADGHVVDPLDLYRAAAPGLLDAPGAPRRLPELDRVVMHGLSTAHLTSLVSAVQDGTGTIVLPGDAVASLTGSKLDIRSIERRP